MARSITLLGLLLCVLLVTSATAIAADAPDVQNADCFLCHDTVSFAVPAVDRDTVCISCHATGLLGAHPYHQAGSNCAANCHPSWGESLLTATPSVLDPGSGAAFASADSIDTPASMLHIIHSQARWPGDLEFADSRCSSCHATASCDACHTGSIDSGHENHSSTLNTPFADTFGHGIIGDDMTVRSVATESQMCATAGCHDLATTRGNAAITRENFPHAAYPELGYPEPNQVSYAPSASSWPLSYDSVRSAGRMSYSNYAGAELSISFEGERVLLVADKDPYRGIAEVLIDGAVVATVDLYAPVTTQQATVFDSGPLGSGSHTIAVRATGTKNASSRYTYVTVDCFRVYEQAPASIAPECLGCHATQHDFVTLHDSSAAIVPDNTDCVTCHVDYDALTVHAGSCAGCHDIASPARGVWSRRCVDCHNSTVAGTYDYQPYNPNHYDPYVAEHTATPPNEWLVVVGSGHDSEMHGADGEVFMGCSSCHAMELGPGHAMECFNCHPAPYDSLTSWDRSCQDGGCHTSYHGDVRAAHDTVDDSACSNCHGADWGVTPAKCANCHATYSAGDSTPPSTTSNVQASYVGAAIVAFTMTESGKVGIGTTYYRIDGAEVQTGSEAIVSAPGTHTVEFWSVDQTGNIETPAKSATFHVEADATPPVTTSNAQASYYGYPANITLNATDASTYGVKATYYSLNGGAVQTGTRVYVPALTGTYSYTLDFWSEDWSGNVEATHTVSFNVTGGSGTLRLMTGTVATGEWIEWRIWKGAIDATPDYTIYREGPYTPPSGYIDQVVPVSLTPYNIRLDWGFFDGNGNPYLEDQWGVGSFTVDDPGEIVVVE